MNRIDFVSLKEEMMRNMAVRTNSSLFFESHRNYLIGYNRCMEEIIRKPYYIGHTYFST